MEGDDANLQEPRVKTENANPIRSSIKESPFPAPSSSLKSSSPDFLRNVQAAFKRRRPHNTSQLSSLMPRRIVLPQRETPNNADKNLFLKEKESVSAFSVTQEDASITPPSIMGTMTNTLDGICNQKPSSSCRDGNAKIISNVESRHVPPVEGLRRVHFATESNATSRETEWETSNQANPGTSMKNDGKQHPSQSVDTGGVLRSEGASSRFTVGRSAPRDQLDHLSNFLQGDATYPMTQSSVCATSISVHATSAPLANSTTICSSSCQEQMHERRAQQPHPSTTIGNHHVADSASNAAQASTSGVHAQGVKEADQVPRGSEIPKCTSIPDPNPTKGIEDVGKTSGMQSEGLPSKISSSDVKSESSKIEKQAKSVTEKGGAPARKKNYDSDMFFKVNGKLYQRLGKIGSGGSSEVHKVISCDCKIYALKKIRLKGRDYATAYGFCQEILYLNKLKGKNNIIQLIDYEVTDKALLEEVMTDSLCNKDGRLKDDGYIYMVLEYGEIDLAHMLSQKWKDMEPSETTIDENWLRFYWQQILQAVNTIHEERIVHSDLKPANFLLVRGSLKLIDFGIAKAIMSDTTNIQRDAQKVVHRIPLGISSTSLKSRDAVATNLSISGIAVGTLSYMSPEAFMCNETDENGNLIKCGRPSDIWSLGCILYQMVYGRTPFAEYKTFWAKFKVITDPHHQIPYPPLPNPWLLDLMKRCLAWDRHERWRIPQLLHHPFLVPPVPTHLSHPQDHASRAVQAIAESHSTSNTVGALCFQLQRLLASGPESRDEQCELLTRILDVGSRLREEIMK